MGGVRLCSTEACRAHSFWDRDDNATRNIWAAHVWLTRLGAASVADAVAHPDRVRPPHLRRGGAREQAPPYAYVRVTQ